MKNLLLFSTLLITTAGAFAQLSVKPNGTTDSYVYVKDQVLYVANEINLTRNTNGPSTTEASIYLRDNGQLIQGGTTSTNSGNGQLSVQQNTPEFSCNQCMGILLLVFPCYPSSACCR